MLDGIALLHGAKLAEARARAARGDCAPRQDGPRPRVRAAAQGDGRRPGGPAAS